MKEKRAEGWGEGITYSNSKGTFLQGCTVQVLECEHCSPVCCTRVCSCVVKPGYRGWQRL